ncbi:hypothetical protein IAQ61_002959 [Plenodomus lingam]|uniref:uncharacterized protein n=1 Tax=Leptosphaeria maculans TaxID=5022 RepID=UPI0033166ABF|nr:hypothetical protein IAQ61_002959 [Plenodomus lingam]
MGSLLLPDSRLPSQQQSPGQKRDGEQLIACVDLDSDQRHAPKEPPEFKTRNYSEPSSSSSSLTTGTGSSFPVVLTFLSFSAPAGFLAGAFASSSSSSDSWGAAASSSSEFSSSSSSSSSSAESSSSLALVRFAFFLGAGGGGEAVLDMGSGITMGMGQDLAWRLTWIFCVRVVLVKGGTLLRLGISMGEWGQLCCFGCAQEEG